MVTLVLGGHDEKTIDQIRKAVERKRPVVIVKEKEKKKEKETSDIPMLLAELFFKLDGEVSRSAVLPHSRARIAYQLLSVLCCVLHQCILYN